MAQRLQGWLQVADKTSLELQRSTATRKPRRLGRKRPKETEAGPCAWRSYFCSLHTSDRTLRHSLSERKGSQTRGRTLSELRLRLERGRRYLGCGLEAQTPSPVTEEDDSELSETTSLRDDRILLRSIPSGVSSNQTLSIGSVTSEDPKRHTIGFSCLPDDSASSPYEQSPVGTPTKAMDTPTPSRIASFFSKRSLKSVGLKRTKSVTKLERKRCALDSEGMSSTQLRGSRSHESLLQSSPSILGTVDLSGNDVRVSSVHSSLLDQNYCFQLSSKDGTTYYSCQTNQEKDKWIHNLQQTIQPHRDHQRRTEKSLNIWLLEAKGISGKKKYFCELCLDKTLYARTSSKVKNDLCFWGEHFEFNNLPQLDTITVNLYREADKKKRRDKNILIGSAVIHVNSLSNQHLTEKWYPVFLEKNSSGKECPSLRIKSRFLNLTILPFNVYSDFLQYLKEDYKTMCEILEPAVSVRTKEDIATSLIYVMEKENIAKKFLIDILMAEIEKIDDQRLMFRGNSTATKAIEAYMKLIGEKYLQDTLGEAIKILMASSDECEVDPIKVLNNSVLLQHQNNLMNNVEMVWNRITASASLFPLELREIFSQCRQKLAEKGKDEEMCDNLISASVFLRFLCPAILSPSLFNLAQEYPQGKIARKLTLIAKSIQTFANFTRFGGKESFMEFMNEFLEREWTSMKSFLKEISSPILSQPQPVLEFDGPIDEGRELAILHNLLVDATSRITDKSSEELDKLQRVLDGISAALSQPVLSRQMSSPLAAGQTASNGHTLSSVPEKSNIPPPPPRSSTMPRTTFLAESRLQPLNDSNTTGDYVMLSAVNAVDSSQRDTEPISHSYSVDSERGISYINHDFICDRDSPSAFRQASRLHSERRSFNTTPRSHFPADSKHMRKQLWKHNKDSEEPIVSKHLPFSSLPVSQPTNQLNFRNCQGYNSAEVRRKSSNSPHLVPPLAFNNPMYQHRVPSAAHEKSPLSSYSSESDDEIAVIGRTCLGSAESEPALALCSRYCCTSSSSTDTNSCESPPPLHQSKLKASKHSKGSQNALKRHEHHQGQPSRSSSDTCSFGPKAGQVHRSSTDSGLHKSFRSTLKCTNYPTCAAQDRSVNLNVRNQKLYSKNAIDEYERQVQELRSLMGSLQSKLQDAEKKLNSQEGKTEAAILEWKKRMEAEEERIKRQQEEKDEQMKSIITRLITVEEELKKEQREMSALIADKQKVIDAQEKKIITLDATNTHLLAVLSQVRAQCPLKGRNGSTSPLKNNFVNRDPLYKSSSC